MAEDWKIERRYQTCFGNGTERVCSSCRNAMSRFYHAILVDGQLHWLDDVPESLRRGTKEVQVRVTIEKQDNGDDEGELSSLLDELAEADPFSDIDDPVEWQRGLRRG
jgi:hypothetical protein